MTEPEAGSDAGATRTRAEPQGDGGFVVDGQKMFITNAGTDITACCTITALTAEHEITNLIVPADAPGYRPGPPLRKIGWHASDTRPVFLEGVRLDGSAQLGPRGAGLRQFLQVLDGGRLSVGAMGLGLAQGAFDLALDHARSRRQFGQAIVGFQAIQFQLAEMARLFRDAKVLDIGEGTTEVQKMVIAREIGAHE